jgi:hypothetical protein
MNKIKWGQVGIFQRGAQLTDFNILGKIYPKMAK